MVITHRHTYTMRQQNVIWSLTDWEWQMQLNSKQMCETFTEVFGVADGLYQLPQQPDNKYRKQWLDAWRRHWGWLVCSMCFIFIQWTCLGAFWQMSTVTGNKMKEFQVLQQGDYFNFKPVTLLNVELKIWTKVLLEQHRNHLETSLINIDQEA